MLFVCGVAIVPGNYASDSRFLSTAPCYAALEENSRETAIDTIYVSACTRTISNTYSSIKGLQTVLVVAFGANESILLVVFLRRKLGIISITVVECHLASGLETHERLRRIFAASINFW